MFSSFVTSVSSNNQCSVHLSYPYLIGAFTVFVRVTLSGTVGVLCWVPLFSICAVALFEFWTLRSETCSFSLAASVPGDGFVSPWLWGPISLLGFKASLFWRMIAPLTCTIYERLDSFSTHVPASQVLLRYPATLTSCPISCSGNTMELLSW